MNNGKQMIAQLQSLLKSHKAYSDGIYGNLSDTSSNQSAEIELRERVAAEHYDNYLDALSRSHSISVMDYEVDLFLARIPRGGLILDIGGCWGWHWRRLAQIRPDVGVIIIDFMRSNLPHAQNILGSLIGNQVVLMHAEATELPFVVDEGFAGFDGVWTVHTFQHIPNFGKAVSEAYRLLKKNGVFINYSLNVQPHIRWLKRLFGREYLSEGWMEGAFWLSRASKIQKECIASVFGNTVSERWLEILYSPELRFYAPGRGEV
jgi:ubiquinone/menaquinone biosynthesis C-methylase UbiE